jgi:hypothetical protein
MNEQPRASVRFGPDSIRDPAPMRLSWRCEGVACGLVAKGLPNGGLFGQSGFSPYASRLACLLGQKRRFGGSSADRPACPPLQTSSCAVMNRCLGSRTATPPHCHRPAQETGHADGPRARQVRAICSLSVWQWRANERSLQVYGTTARNTKAAKMTMCTMP